MTTPYQTMQPVSNVYVLPRCDVSLYATGTGNTLGSLVWTAAQVDNIRVSEQLEEVEVRTTGIPYPEPHHMAARYEVAFDAVWNVSAVVQRNVQYILALTVQDAFLGSTGTWRRLQFYGVTLPRRDIVSRDANEFGSSHTLRAKFMEESNGTGAPPAPS